MHLTGRYLLTAAAALLVAGTAFAQRSSPASASQVTPSHPYSPPLYRNPDVARSLELSRDQISRLNELTDRLQARYRGDFDRVGTADERDRAARRDELMRRYNTDWMRAAEEVLNERQRGRYRQLDLQSRGLDVFSDPEVRDRLKLTEGQLEELRGVHQRAIEERNRFRPTERLRQEDTLRRWRDLEDQTYDRVNRVLTERQRQAWREMMGERYHFPPPGSTNPPGPTTPRGSARP